MGVALIALLAVLVARAPQSEANPPLESQAAASARSLSISITVVLAAVRLAEAAGPDDARAAAELDDAWRILALVFEREQAQLDVATGRRPPLMTAPPLAPGRPGHRAAFHRAALSYLRAALPTRDLDGLERALTLIELGRH
jgi:hypothetical protein